MLELIFAFLLGLACPGNTTTQNTTTNNDHNITMASSPGDVDTGGEGSHIPPGHP
ncbi:hypothetical protein [Pedobacter cryoconitis]|uniref:Uncharacterized protein n=1 Tax=Pedobacter cryoconitis TaxID=188932 RepID=A0A327SX83_9SPHI|nr:hypothetical protein [Pedobacter cryoconitis]RAJ33022.1 hypothetical protein LY11_01712 [Pedobacter cryoconitis]